MCIPAFAVIGTALGASATTAAAVGTMAVAQGVGLGMQVLGAYNQAKYQEGVARNNATMAEYAAQDAEARGEKEAMDARRKGEALKSTQRTAFASKGLDLTYGTTAAIQDQTDFFTQVDVDTTRNNAAKEAWARRAQSQNYQAEAKAANPMFAATSTLLAGGGQVASKWYDWSRS
jgi:hypothetical protein